MSALRLFSFAAPALCLLLSTSTVSAQEIGSRNFPETERTIRVNGVGEVEVQPDEATLSFAVETFASNAKDAGAENARIMERVIAALVGAGIPRADLETRNYSLQPEHVHDPETRTSRVRGYRARNQVVLTTMELTRLGSFIDAALGAGANRMDGLNFSLKNSEEAEAEALRRAVRRAHDTARNIASTLGVSLGEVLDASTSFSPVRPLYQARAPMMLMAADAGMAETPIQAEEQTIRAQISIIFSID